MLQVKSIKDTISKFLIHIDNQSRNLYILANGCCRYELESLFSASYDIERLGFNLEIDKPNEASLVIVSGWIEEAYADEIKKVYDTIGGDKAVLAVGTCAVSAKTFFTNSPILLSDILPINYYVPGCPPRPEAIIEALRAIEIEKTPAKNKQNIIYGAMKEYG